MRSFSFVFIALIFCGIYSGCNDGIGKANENFPNRAEAKSGSDQKASEQTTEILKKSFRRCSNDPDLVYGKQGQYLVELRDWTYQTIPRPYSPMKTERDNKYGWFGTIMMRANSSKRIDTINCSSTPYQEGTGFSNDFFVLTEENSAWRCDTCKEFTAPDCNDVKKILAECDHP